MELKSVDRVGYAEKCHMLFQYDNLKNVFTYVFVVFVFLLATRKRFVKFVAANLCFSYVDMNTALFWTRLNQRRSVRSLKTL